MEQVMNNRIQEAKIETDVSQQIEIMDAYLNKANEIKKALLDLIKIYDRRNKGLTVLINKGEISLTNKM